MLKWPDRNRVHQAAQAWACEQAARHSKLHQMGYFGSYARGDWGVGSDLDLIAVVEHAILPFEARARAWNIEDLPVPAELLVYTEYEWQQLGQQSPHFAHRLASETIWLFKRPA